MRAEPAPGPYHSIKTVHVSRHPYPATSKSSQRPKSALRRRMVDREEGDDLDDEDEEDSDAEFDQSSYEKFFQEGS